MVSHIGEIIEINLPESGLTLVNDHVEVVPSILTRRELTSISGINDPEADWDVFYRTDYNKTTGKYVSRLPTDIETSEIKIEDALRIGEELAKKGGAVLLLDEKIERTPYRKIIWHPDGWEPKYESCSPSPHS